MIPKSIGSDELLPHLSDLTDDQRQRIAYPAIPVGETGVYGPVTNGQRIAYHLKPEVRAGISTLCGALLRHGALDPALREMIIVRIGYVAASRYEVHQHRSLAERVGVPEAKLDALACVRPSGLAPQEQMLIAFVDELLTRNRPTDATLAAVREHFDETQVMEIIAVTGAWWMLARMMETAGVPLDPGTIGEHGVAAER